jgi:hypothetical protein
VLSGFLAAWMGLKKLEHRRDFKRVRDCPPLSTLGRLQCPHISPDERKIDPELNLPFLKFSMGRVFCDTESAPPLPACLQVWLWLAHISDRWRVQ